MLTTLTLVLALAASGAAAFAVVRLSKVNMHVLDLGRRVLESEDVSRMNEAARKAETFESRLAGCEKKAEECQKQLAEFGTKQIEFGAKVESVEQAANKNESCLAELVPSIKVLADEVQTIRKFQTATEKVHSLIQAAFSDIQTSMSPADDFGLKPAEPKETSEGPQEWWQAGDGDKSGT